MASYFGNIFQKWQYLSRFKLNFDGVKVKVGLLSLYNLTNYQFSENFIQTKLAPASAELGTAQLQLVDTLFEAELCPLPSP